MFLDAENLVEKAFENNIDQSAIQKFIDTFPEKALNLGVRVLLALVGFFIGRFLIQMVRKIIKRSLTRIKAEEGLINFLDSFTKVSLYIVLILLIANYFGLDAASVIAILGSAGVAIGLAVQGSLSNFVGGVLILLLKPFKVGDYIIEDTYKNEGTVVAIQLFFTKLRTLDNREVILPNGTLANTSLTNVTSSKQRMLIINVGISYDSDLKKAKEIVSEILAAEESVLHDKKILVYVDELADSSVVIGSRCYVPTSKYWDTRWRVIENIKLAFDEQGIVIPFNQLDVHFGDGSMYQG